MELYGIPNCDQVRKARAWLEKHRYPYRFVDFKKEGIDQNLIVRWQQTVGWENLLNRRGTTWRNLPAAQQAAVVDAPSAAAVAAEFPSLLKRPVLVDGERVVVGFSEAAYLSVLQTVEADGR